MMKNRAAAALLAGIALNGFVTNADPSDFKKGPLIQDFGPVAPVAGASVPADTRFFIAFDVAERGKEGAVSRRLESAARFLNMQVQAGVPAKNVKLAVVIHGSAVFDVTNNEKYGGENANAGLIAALQNHGVSFHVCGQSAAYHGVELEDLLPGVTMELSAMTAHALLQQQGYTLNPF